MVDSKIMDSVFCNGKWEIWRASVGIPEISPEYPQEVPLQFKWECPEQMKNTMCMICAYRKMGKIVCQLLEGF